MKLEGINAVSEGLKSGVTIEKVFVENGLRDKRAKDLVNEIREKKIKVQFLNRAEMDKESQTKRHQGFIAITTDFNYSELEDLLTEDENGVIVILDGIEDPHNLGSIIRVCECAGANGIIIPKHRCVQVNETVMRVSAGSSNHVKVAKVNNLNYTIDALKENGYFVVGAEVGGQEIYKSNLKGKIALVIGGENTGIKRLTKEKCDMLVTIPMFGKVNSLNASVACGIALFECVRQRLNNGKN